jgi:hypothetical protein
LKCRQVVSLARARASVK